LLQALEELAHSTCLAEGDQERRLEQRENREKVEEIELRHMAAKYQSASPNGPEEETTVYGEVERPF
jgi:hypothetical protein